MSLLEVEELFTHFHTPDGLVRAVDGVSLDIEAGKSVAIVGESGSGKSVLNLTLLGLVPCPPGIVNARAIRFEGRDLLNATPEEFRKIRGNRIAMIFQDPMTSLNPFLTIGDQLSEPLLIHRGMSARDAQKRVVEVLSEVGLPDPERSLRAYPHHFSGGMRQRAMVAMALVCEPVLLIADEPTTALDVTIQAQILDLMIKLRQEHGTTVILITHDLGVAAGFSDEINVMYAGKIVEHAKTAELFSHAAHPYTRALLESVPRLDVDTKESFHFIPGQPPDLMRLPRGCAFAPRCGHVIERCRESVPPLESMPGREGQSKACFVDLSASAETES